MRSLDLSGITDRIVRTTALDSAYTTGFSGCYLPTDTGERGAEARHDADKFRVDAGNNRFEFAHVAHEIGDLPPRNGVEGCYVWTGPAFEEFSQHNEGYENWIYGMQQARGNCVGASFAEMTHAMLGLLSQDASNPYLMVALGSMWPYCWRGCGSGWNMSSCASVALEHGWCPCTIFDGRKIGTLDVPSYRDTQFDGEGEQEQLCSGSGWCRGGPPEVIQQWVLDNFTFASGSIVETECSTEGLFDTSRKGGFVHHGSNATGTGNYLDKVKRIGGHAQTDYGSDRSQQAIEFFSSRGVRCSTSNYIKPQGQTWGPSFGMDASDWPVGSDDTGRVYTQADVNNARRDRSMYADLMASISGDGWGWGPMPEGSWIVTSDTFQRNFCSRPYSYFASGMKGVPATAPTPPIPPVQEWPEVKGTIYGDLLPDGRIAIRGIPTLVLEGGCVPGSFPYLVAPVPGKPGQFELTPKIL